MQSSDFVLSLDTLPDAELHAVPARAREVVADALQAMRRMQGGGLFPREHEIRQRGDTVYELRTYGYPQPITQRHLESIARQTNALEVYMRLSDAGSQLQARGALVVHVRVPPPTESRKRASSALAERTVDGGPPVRSRDDDEYDDDDSGDELVLPSSSSSAKKRHQRAADADDNEPGWLAWLFRDD